MTVNIAGCSIQAHRDLRKMEYSKATLDQAWMLQKSNARKRRLLSRMNAFSLPWKQLVREPGMWMLTRDGAFSSVIARCCSEGEREIRFRNFWNGCIQMTARGFARRWSHQN